MRYSEGHQSTTVPAVRPRGGRNYFSGVLVALAMLAGFASAQEEVPQFTKSFLPDTIGPGSTTTLTFEIANKFAPGIRGLRFDDKLPAGVVIATPANLRSDCGGTVTAKAGDNTISLSEGSVPGGGVCRISVDVTSSVIGTHTNISEDLISDIGNSGKATADLIVSKALPGFSMSFSPNQIGLGDRSRLTFTIDNSVNESPRFDLEFTDFLPVGVVLADPANLVSTCGGKVVAQPGGNTIRLQPESLPQAAVDAFEVCTISVDVIGTGIGLHHNISGQLTSADEPFSEKDPVSSGKASDSLLVTSGEIALSKRFTDDPVPAGGTTTLEYKLTNRSRDSTAREITFEDDLDRVIPGLASVSQSQFEICGGRSVLEGSSILKFSGGELAPGQSCSFSVQVRVPTDTKSGAYPSATGPVTARVGGRSVEGTPAKDTLFVSPVPIFTKRFIDDPVTPGDVVTLEFRITNTSLNFEATEISFLDELPGQIADVAEIPKEGFCGPESTLTVIPPDPFPDGAPFRLRVAGGSLQPQETCTFRVQLIVSENAATGTVTNTTEPLTALIDDVVVTAPPASDELRIFSGPQLTKTFLADSVVPGEVVLLRFTLTHSSEAPGTATNIRFTDILGGMEAEGLPKNNICGDGSRLRGTTVITFDGGSLKPGETCSFDVPIRIPKNAALGPYLNTTSAVLSEIGGQRLASSPATDNILISNLTFTKRFADSPVIPGDTTRLEFIIRNDGSTPVTNISFTDNLDDALPGLVAISKTQRDICGQGSSIEGDTELVFQGGRLTENSSCSFAVEVRIPANTPEGDYINATSELLARVIEIPVTIPPATALLSVTDRLLAIEKSFVRNPVLIGEPNGIEFTITNLDPDRQAKEISFTDVLQGGIVGVGSTQKDICGEGSQIGGTSTLTFSGGVLQRGASCTFIVPVMLPAKGSETIVENVTSEVVGTIDGFTVRGDPASATLAVNAPPGPEGVGFVITRSELKRDGSFLIEWPGLRGVDYCVQWSPDLQRWFTFDKDFLGGDDTIQWVDPTPPVGRGFYRVIQKIDQ